MLLGRKDASNPSQVGAKGREQLPCRQGNLSTNNPCAIATPNLLAKIVLDGGAGNNFPTNTNTQNDQDNETGNDRIQAGCDNQ